MVKLSIVALLILSLALAASAFPEGATCGHDHTHAALSVEERDAQQAFIHEVRASANMTRRNGELFRIPVVWHVLTNSGAPDTNLPRSAIETEMSNLNAWFSAQNAAFTTSDAFGPSVARGTDLNIRFFLAEKDPQGNPFNGIRYIDSPLAASGCSSGSTANFFTAQGGADMWSSSDYFNVYTCGIPGGVAGFAYFPQSQPFAYDGAVMDYIYIGQGTGSILAHEAGHWLGLPHTFNQEACGADDGFADTPNTNAPASSWVPSNDRCNRDDLNTAAFQRCSGETVMVRNVMDYNSDSCQSYFSRDQAAEMRSQLSSPSSNRYNLQFSPALPAACANFDCVGKNCGSDGCGGVCGTCGAFGVCNADQQCTSTVPDNINCETAQEIAQTTDGTTVVKNNGGVNSNFIMSSCGGSRYNTAATWFRFTAVASGTGTVSTAGSSVAAMVDVFYTADGSCNGFYCAGSGGGGTSKTFNVQQGRTYRIIVSSVGTARGDISLTLTMTGTGFQQSACTPDCAGKQCGSDGCGGQCGSCTGGQTCNGNNQCISAPSASPTRTPPASASRSSAPSSSSAASRSRSPIPSATPTVSDSASRNAPPPSASRTPSTSGAPPPSATSQASASRTSGASASRTSAPSASRIPAASTSPVPTPTPTPTPPCYVEQVCADRNIECGIVNEMICGLSSPDCGRCDSNLVCNTNNSCVCPAGMQFVESRGACEFAEPNGLPDFSGDFVQVRPASPLGVDFTASGMEAINSNENLLVWSSSSGVVDAYTTVQELTIFATTGTVAVNLRHGQSTDTNDRLSWEFSSINGNTATLNFVAFYRQNRYQFSVESGLPFASAGGVKVTVTMEFDDAQNAIFSTISFPGRVITRGILGGYYRELGALSYTLRSDGATISNLRMATASTLRITLSECLDDVQFQDMFNTLSGADPNTSSVTITASDANAQCGKGATHGKAFVSSFTMVVTSAGIPAAKLASNFVAAANAPGFFAVNAAAVIPGTAGATAAGFPAAGAAGTAALVAPGAGAGAGAGGAAGGLSGGAIAGIVIGSVAGGILLIGVAALVVAAVVVAAVVLTKDDDSASRAEPAKRSSSIRRNIRSFFGGVDVMNSPGNGHQSITGRSPAMN